MNSPGAGAILHHLWTDTGHRGDLTTITTRAREAHGHLGLLSLVLLQVPDLDRQGGDDIKFGLA